MINSDSGSFRGGQYVEEDQFGALFDDAWEKMSHRFVKYEALSRYDESGPLHDFLRGDYDSFAAGLKAARAEDKPYFERARARGVTFLRVHAVTPPLNDYLKYEYYSYRLSRKLGEQIFYVLESTVREVANCAIPDLIAFDEEFVFFQDYDSAGHLKGAWLCRDCEKNKQTVALIDRLAARRLELEQVYSGDPHILRLLED